MKTTLASLGIAAGVAVLALFAQPRELSPTRDFMRQKLDHAQSVLEGITSENFEMILAQAAKLKALSSEAAWRAMDTPEYAQQSALFQSSVDALAKSARNRNLDGATLAYAKMTFSCVECQARPETVQSRKESPEHRVRG